MGIKRHTFIKPQGAEPIQTKTKRQKVYAKQKAMQKAMISDVIDEVKRCSINDAMITNDQKARDLSCYNLPPTYTSSFLEYSTRIFTRGEGEERKCQVGGKKKKT